MNLFFFYNSDFLFCDGEKEAGFVFVFGTEEPDSGSYG